MNLPPGEALLIKETENEIRGREVWEEEDRP